MIAPVAEAAVHAAGHGADRGENVGRGECPKRRSARTAAAVIAAVLDIAGAAAAEGDGVGFALFEVGRAENQRGEGFCGRKRRYDIARLIRDADKRIRRLRFRADVDGILRGIRLRRLRHARSARCDQQPAVYEDAGFGIECAVGTVFRAVDQNRAAGHGHGVVGIKPIAARVHIEVAVRDGEGAALLAHTHDAAGAVACVDTVIACGDTGVAAGNGDHGALQSLVALGDVERAAFNDERLAAVNAVVPGGGGDGAAVEVDSIVEWIASSAAPR